MGPDQLASVMDTVSGKTASTDTAAKEKRSAALRERIENESSALYSTARLWDDGIIKPSDTRDILGLALELAEEEKLSRVDGSAGGRGEIGADGDAGGWGVFRM
jgi:3-methylcrotonyl-CoA carboxylase beta subunit